MAFDLTRSYFNDIRERAVLASATISEEGQLLMYVDAGDGTLAVNVSAGASTDRIAGFAITDALKYVTTTVVEEVTVPVGGGTVSLRQNNLVASSTRAVGSVTGALTAVGGAPAAGEFQMAIVAGTITFNTAQAGETVTVTYRYTPTLDEVLATYHERSVNNRAQDYFSSVGVGCESGEIFLTTYDTTLAYAVGGLVYSGAAGLVTSAATSTVVVGIISQIPSVADGRLGVKFANLR